VAKNLMNGIYAQRFVIEPNFQEMVGSKQQFFSYEFYL